MPANLENWAVAIGLEKVSFHSNPKERQCQRMLQLLHNALISHTSKVMLRFFQARLQQYVNCELPDVQAGFRKGRGTRDQIANIRWFIKKATEFQKNIYCCFYWLCQSHWLCGWQLTMENSSRDENTRPPDSPPEKSIYRSGSNS